VIEFRDVAVCYAPDARYPVNALEGVNLKIEKGEWVFFVGPSGAGKSTLLKLLYGAAAPVEGQVFLQGRDVSRLEPRDVPFLRRRIGVIFQDFLLMPQKTVWENVAYALQVIGTPQKMLAREVPRALETVGLHNKATMRPGQLSGGEQQRVAIARAIVNRPSLVLADEPTGNLDPQTGTDIIEVLQKINAEGTTILMATHDRGVVDTLRRRVVRLADGRVQSDDKHGVYNIADGVLSQPRIAASVVSSPAPAPAPPAPVAQAPALSAPAPPPHKDRSEAAAPNPEPLPVRAPWRPRSASLPSAVAPSAADQSEAQSTEPEDAQAPRAPLGSPENPLVQFDRPASRTRRSGEER
jgi:cell division transport system ATP-binding protein